MERTGRSERLYRIVLDGFRMELWQSLSAMPSAYNYTMLFAIVAQPREVCLVPLGDDLELAVELFSRKIEAHKRMMA